MPEALLAKVLRQSGSTSFATSSTLSCAVDLDLARLETRRGRRYGVREVRARTLGSRPTWRGGTAAHFRMVFGSRYAAGYYSYLWSEVLDADAFEAFEETGDVFDPALAKRLHDHVYSAGYRQDAAAAYTAFRGRLPSVDALLRKRGLDGQAADTATSRY